MHHVPVRSKLGPASKQQLKFLSPRHRRLLSILFLSGLFFFAILSFTIYVKDPESNNVRSAAQVGASRIRRALNTGVQDVERIVLHRSRGAAAPLRIMLASHNRLFWLHTDTGNTTVIHEGGVSGAACQAPCGTDVHVHAHGMPLQHLKEHADTCCTHMCKHRACIMACSLESTTPAVT